MRVPAVLARQLPPRFVRFCVVGAVGAVVDMGFFWVFGELVGLPLLFAKGLATEMAIVNNFVWNDRWTFGDVAAKETSPGARLRRFFTFNLICAGGLALNLLLVHTQIATFGLNRYLANAVAIGLVTAWNFGMNRKLSWTERPVQAVRSASPASARIASSSSV